jgi:hypothetical protein
MTTLLPLPQDTTDPVAEALGRASRSPRPMKCQLSRGIESVTIDWGEFAVIASLMPASKPVEFQWIGTLAPKLPAHAKQLQRP